MQNYKAMFKLSCVLYDLQTEFYNLLLRVLIICRYSQISQIFDFIENIDNWIYQFIFQFLCFLLFSHRSSSSAWPYLSKRYSKISGIVLLNCMGGSINQGVNIFVINFLISQLTSIF